LSMLSFFSLYCSVDHRDLHSFPTRRSSDLSLQNLGQDIRILPRPIDKRTMTYSTIELIYEAALATITLNRPEKRNAISFELISDLMRALDGVARSSARVLIVTGAGKALCSGMDLEN